jgi:hypothetical protein
MFLLFTLSLFCLFLSAQNLIDLTHIGNADKPMYHIVICDSSANLCKAHANDSYRILIADTEILNKVFLYVQKEISFSYDTVSTSKFGSFLLTISYLNKDSEETVLNNEDTLYLLAYLRYLSSENDVRWKIENLSRRIMFWTI